MQTSAATPSVDATVWSANQYTRFENERTRPVRDLVAAIPDKPVGLAIDIGCGPGNSTEVLARRFPDAVVSGIDSSVDMIASARSRLPGIRFDIADIAAWKPAAQYDVILANAALQWLPDHPSLYPWLAGHLAPGGSLAIQTPDNIEEPAHRLTREVAASGPWAAKLAGVRHLQRHDITAYYEMLRPHCTAVDVWRTTYFHPLAGADAIVEWFKGSALRPYLAPLDAEEQKSFLERYRAGIAEAYRALHDGTTLLPFPRIFIVATR